MFSFFVEEKYHSRELITYLTTEFLHHKNLYYTLEVLLTSDYFNENAKTLFLLSLKKNAIKNLHNKGLLAYSWKTTPYCNDNVDA